MAAILPRVDELRILSFFDELVACDWSIFSNRVVDNCVCSWCVQWPPVSMTYQRYPHYWPFVVGIHRSPVVSLRKGLMMQSLMCALMSVGANSWTNSRVVSDFKTPWRGFNVPVISWLSRMSVLYTCWMAHSIVLIGTQTKCRPFCRRDRFSLALPWVKALNFE